MIHARKIDDDGLETNFGIFGFIKFNDHAKFYSQINTYINSNQHFGNLFAHKNVNSSFI